IQTIGRAARNVSGQVHMYADTITPSMATAIEETNRRREKQIAYNTERGIDPQPLRKKIVDILDGIYREAEDADGAAAKLLGGSGRQQSRGKAPVPGLASKAGRSKAGAIHVDGMPRAELADLITQMNEQMLAAARELQFEVAARLRDELVELKKELRQMNAAHA
ncbi:MAG: UvrB/UvrC motif-containing protein, partial [Actinomycetota bacterium]|nr:UvrB/UvrC motif-containing protein [Actinomycetota bacterium]